MEVKRLSDEELREKLEEFLKLIQLKKMPKNIGMLKLYCQNFVANISIKIKPTNLEKKSAINVKNQNS